MTWEWMIAIDLWVAGIAGGAYFAAFLVNRLSGGKHKEMVQWAVYVGVPLVLLGSMLLATDLGEPFRAWHLFVGLQPSSWMVASAQGAASLRAWPPYLNFYPISPMSMGSWILFIWAIIGVVLIALWFAQLFKAVSEEKEIDFFGGVASFLYPLVPAIGFFEWVAFFLSVLLITYTGVLLSATNQALWSWAFFLPALFVSSAILTGIAVILIIGLISGGEEPGFREALAKLSQAYTIVIVVEIAALIGLFIWLSAFSTAASAQAVGLLLSGPLSLYFWIGVVLVGLLIPLGLGVLAWRRRGTAISLAMALSALCVLAGGFILRTVIILGGQM